MKTILFSILFFSFTLVLSAQNEAGSNIQPTNLQTTTAPQDTLVKRNGEKIVCKVKEIGTSEIKYSSPEYNADLLFAIGKNDIDYIVFANGKVQKFDRTAYNDETIEKNSRDLYQNQHKIAVKTDFLSLATNTTSLTFEKCLRPGQSVEFSLGAVGLGFGDLDEKASGILFRGGYKFMRNPDFYMKDMRYAHILKGRYIKLEFDFASYSAKDDYAYDNYNNETDNITKWAALVVFGNQWVFNDSFLIDLYSGIGLGGNNCDGEEYYYPHGFLTVGNESPFAFSFGLRLGFLLK
jgi:hypothetical protein